MIVNQSLNFKLQSDRPATSPLNLLNFRPSLNLLDGISIVVPTFKRVNLCHKLFDSLVVSRSNLDFFVEVIVVDNSPDPEAAQIKFLCQEYGIDYYWRSLPVGVKRNFGARVAKFGIILFIDSDCEATPNLIREHWQFYRIHPNAFSVLGKTEFKGKKNFIWQVVEWTPFLMPFTLGDRPGKQVWGPSNNFSIRKTTFQEIGGFNKYFPHKPGGEDVDLGYRLYKKGYTLDANPDAVVFHTTETWNTWRQLIQRFFHWGQGEFYIYSNHDEYLYYDCPKPLALTGLLLVVMGLMAAWKMQLGWLTVPVIFLAIHLMVRIGLHGYRCRVRLREIPKLILAELLEIVYESGLTYQCLQQRWFLPLYHCLIIQPEKAVTIWNRQFIYSWILFVEIVASLILGQLVVEVF